MLIVFDGETIVKISKMYAKILIRSFGLNSPMNKGIGRQIDLILSARKVEL